MLKEIFSTPIWESSVQKQETFPALLAVLENMYKDDETFKQEEYPNGYTTYHSKKYDLLYDKRFDELKALIEKEVSKYMKSIGFDFENFFFRIDTLFGNIGNKYSSHGMHLHPETDFAGCIYLHATQEHAPHINQHPAVVGMMTLKRDAFKEDNQYFASDMTFEVETGKIILFPAWIMHQVDVQRVDDSRVAVAFNIKIRHKENV